MRAYYTADRAQFFADTDEHILGALAKGHSFALEMTQREAWAQQITLMRTALRDHPDFTLYFEFAIPRMGKRADVVVLIGDCVFVIEFKVGAATFDRHAIEQVEDYALDLKNFHLGSHDLAIVPVLVPTKALASGIIQFELPGSHVAKPLCVCPDDLGYVLKMFSATAAAPFDAHTWAATGYRPTPTIIEAARALYARHDVRDIARSDAGALNLGRTQEIINRVVETSRTHRQKSICFVTGVPGAGKTLAGLNIATQRSGEGETHATFLSGNGPLVAVLSEALIRDQQLRTGGAKTHIARNVHAFIQNIHHFRDYYLRSHEVPSDHIVVFDEAQRAWTRAKAASFMQQKRAVANFDMSEPEFLLQVMDRHDDWCTVVCLIGGGQEINTGEAGLSEWMAAIRDHFAHWRVHASVQITQPDYDLNHDAQSFIKTEQVTLHDDLHLSVSMRSFRAETLSDFVAQVLNGDAEAAQAAYERLGGNYPIYLTRDLGAAREWLRKTARGSERFGLIASSGALRLKPEGVHIKSEIDPANWFLNDRADVRSSYYLEDVATEFDVQGLELDWVGVCWDADLRHDGHGWQLNKFKGTKWQLVKDRHQRLYLKNAYRVILTRARQGMVIFVPKGDDRDPTRQSEFYDDTFRFLQSCGIPLLN